MKILIVCPRLCHGGAERVAVSLANGFVSRGHQVQMMSDLYDEITFHVDEDVILSNLVSYNKNKIIKWLSAIANIRNACKKEKPDVIIGIMELCSFVSRIATVGMDIPVIATEHDAFERPKSAPMPFILKMTKFYLNRIYTKVTVLTAADKLAIGRKLNNAVVMPNPLALKPTKELLHKEKIILAAGRVDNWHCKGFDILVRAWGKIAKKYPEWKLEIAGVYLNAETRPFLDGIAMENGVSDSVVYLGFVDDMKSLYKKSSIFVLSSRYEGFGLVLIEAMSQGCACVASDYMGRQKEIITNAREGITCLPENVNALADSIEQLLVDSNYRHAVQSNAIQRSEYYSIDKTVERWENLFNTILK